MGKIVKVSGPLVVATGLQEANMADVVRVGEQGLIGEVLTMNGDTASIQVYEETSGLGPGAEVVTTGAPLSVELGPGLIENIYDGIQRPLEVIMETVKGNNLPRGVEVPALDREKKWDFQAVVEPGTQVVGGDIIGTVQETPSILHKIMIPPRMQGKIVSIQSGSYTVTETVAVLEREDGSRVELPMMQKWPVRVGRPYKHKYPPVVPLSSGQRVHLHRHHHRRVFPGHGLRRGRHRRLHLPLGGGAAGDVRPPGGDARRGGLPRLPVFPPGPVL